MKIAVYGAGYVGLVSAACFASLGHMVICADVNKKRIELLSQGQCPIHEKDLPELLAKEQSAGRLQYTTDMDLAIQTADIHFIAVGTPGLADGKADLSQVIAVTRNIAAKAKKTVVLVTKSTIPVGAGDVIERVIAEEMACRETKVRIHVASNPEFLREGTAVSDFLNAERIVIGGDDFAINALKEVYQGLIERGIPLLSMSRNSAELTKYAANAMLACRISFINQISQIAEATGANIDDIKAGMALDRRIGPYFLNAGIGYGGSCFPKDVRALAQAAKELQIDSHFFDSIDRINEQQKNWIYQKLVQHFSGAIQGKKIGIWGLAFKPSTDDLREASSLVIIRALLAAGAHVLAYDPVAIPAAKAQFSAHEDIKWMSNAEELLTSGLNALVIATEWQEFCQYSLDKIKHYLGEAPVLDGRNCFDLKAVHQAGLKNYYSVGRPPYHECYEQEEGVINDY